MKIIIAHYKFYIQGGPERYMLKFMRLAEEHGHTVIPFSVDYEQNMDSEYSKYFVASANKKNAEKSAASKLTPVSIVKGIWYEFHNHGAYKKLRQLIHDVCPDLLYVLIPGALSPDIFEAAKKENIPIILRLSDFRLLCGKNVLLREEEICEECIYGNYKCMIKHRCVHGSKMLTTLRMLSLSYHRKHKSYRSVDAVIAPPKFTGDKYIESGYFPKDKVHLNPTFIDCSTFEPNYEHKNYVLCLGRFSLEKGFIYAVEAMRYLKELPVTIAITGDWENCDAQLKQVIEKYELREKIKFVGFLHGDALEKMIREALCVACPAIWYDNLPNVVLEAYAYGKPVIASDIGSLAEIVEDGRTGLLFEPKNPEQIAECIRKLYENPELTHQLGRNARAEVEDYYSPEKHWEKFIEICRTIGVAYTEVSK